MNPKPRLQTIKPKIATAETRSALPPPKVADPHYLTPEHHAWRERLLRRAGNRCEAIEHGRRCEKSAPDYRLYADHIRELHDGGGRLDLRNGQILCASHHSFKTVAERAERMRS